MLIPYIQERQELLALHDELEALREQEGRELAPLGANLDEVRRRAEIEFEAAGGVTLEKLLGENAVEVDPDRQRRFVEERREKEMPALEAYHAARGGFEQRADAIREKIETVEKALGAELAESHWREGGGRAFCAITGHPILTSDRVAVVLADALPDAAVMKNEAWVIGEG